MNYIYTIKSKNGQIAGTCIDYNSAIKDANVILKSLFPNAALSEKLNDPVSEPDYLIYEDGKEFIYLKIEKYED